MRRRPVNKDTTDFTKLNTNDSDDEYDPRFKLPKEKRSWTAISRIVFCFLCGLICLTISFMIYLEYGFDSSYKDRMWPLFAIGLLVFIPGAFYIKDAIGYALKIPGYSIPE